MAANKTNKRTSKTSNDRLQGRGESALRLRSDPRTERRYVPRTSVLGIVLLVALLLSGVLLGAGVYSEWLRSSENGPLLAGRYLLLGGALLLALVALVGSRSTKPIRVGDAGVGCEKSSSEIERMEWRHVTRVILGKNTLTFQGSGQAIAIPLRLQPQAAARALAEARARVPKRVEVTDGGAVMELNEDAGVVVHLEAPQVAGARCRASDKLIAFERDARICGACGEAYHKDHVPPKCLTCDAQLVFDG
jgi:hypothetical protein